MVGYHCSPRADLADALLIGGGRTLCVADDQAVARLYLRGGEATHTLYAVEWGGDVRVADEADLIAAWKRVTGRKEYDPAALPVWEAAKNPKVRSDLMATGYDAVAYGDSHDGLDYETTEFLRRPESLRIVAKETLHGD
jgi:hypothetical protein